MELGDGIEVWEWGRKDARGPCIYTSGDPNLRPNRRHFKILPIGSSTHYPGACASPPITVQYSMLDMVIAFLIWVGCTSLYPVDS